MVETRKGFKLIKEFSEGEQVVSMIKYQDAVLIATTKNVYKQIPGTTQFEPIEFWVKEPGPLVAPDKLKYRPSRCIDCDYYQDRFETAPPEFFCGLLLRYKMNAELSPPGDCPLEKI